MMTTETTQPLNFNKLLRDEIVRVCDKEMRQAMNKLRQSNAELRDDVALLKKKVRALEVTAQRAPSPAAVRAAMSPEDLEEMKRQRPTTVMIKQLRQKLEVSQRELGMLLGVSTQAVYLWERAKGKLNLRDRAKAALLEVRKLSRDEAHARLDQIEHGTI